MQGARGFNESQFHVEYLNSAIFAVSKVAGHYSVSHPEIQVRPDFTLQGRQQLVGGWDFNQNPARLSACVQTTSYTCLLSWPLPVNVKFGLTLKLHEKLAGWLHGRLTEAESSIVPAADGDQLFTYQGKPSVAMDGSRKIICLLLLQASIRVWILRRSMQVDLDGRQTMELQMAQTGCLTQSLSRESGMAKEVLRRCLLGSMPLVIRLLIHKMFGLFNLFNTLAQIPV